MSEAEAILKKAGLHLDDLHRLRLLAPDAWDTTIGLSEQSKEFSAILTAFNKSGEALIKTFEELATLVEAEKLRAMTLKDQMQSRESAANSTESNQRQVLIRQKQVELERLRIELAAAQKVEAEQKEFMQRFTAG